MQLKRNVCASSNGICAITGLLLAAAVACAQADVDGKGVGVGSGASNGGGANSGNGANSGTAGNGLNLPDMLEGSPGQGEGCNDLDAKPELVIPTVALVIDRSSSMTEAYGAASRWDVLKKTLMDPDAGIIKPKQASIRFGLALYTSTANAPTCPMLDSVDFALGGYDAINGIYGPSVTPNVKAETPTAEAIRAVTDRLLAVVDKGPKYILLATDGEPDTCPGTCTGDCPVHERPNFPRDPNCGQDESISAVQAAYAKGIKTFVVAIGTEVGEAHLRALANAGQGLPPVLGDVAYNWLRYSCNIKPGNLKGKYVDLALDPNSNELRIAAPMQTPMQAETYRPENATVLAQDLGKILNTVSDCSFRLKGAVTADSERFGKVSLNDVPLMHTDANGWRLKSPTEVELLGTACTTVQSSSDWNLKISFPCGTFNPE